MVSLLIKNASVIDGTGAPALSADIAIGGDRIRRIAPNLDLAAERTIDAAGYAAAPGFIDIHAHGGSAVIDGRTADSKVHDGVTTEVDGNCGYSPFPTRMEDGGYRSAADFFEILSDAGMSINRAFLTGLGSVRSFVMGRSSRAASPREIELMQTEVIRSLDEGCFGVSAGLIYPPGCFASQEEIAAVAKPAGDRGALYATHMRSESGQIEEAIDESEFIARTSGARLQISHVKLSGKQNWHKIDWLDRRLHGMIASGIDLACDRYPYTASATDIGVILPNWVHDGPVEARMERLHDPGTRSRIEQEVFADHPEPEYWDSIVLSSVPVDEDPEYNGKTLREIAEIRGERPVDAVMNLLAQHREKPTAVFFSMFEEVLRRILSWPFVCIGSDARARVLQDRLSPEKPHPRAYGTFARFLGKYVREEKLMSLEEGVRRITSLPAQRLGLTDRGVLREGAFADITVFAPGAIADRATYEDPHQTSAGIPYVIVNGQAVIEKGVHNGLLPGRALRRTE